MKTYIAINRYETRYQTFGRLFNKEAYMIHYTYLWSGKWTNKDGGMTRQLNECFKTLTDCNALAVI